MHTPRYFLATFSTLAHYRISHFSIFTPSTYRPISLKPLLQKLVHILAPPSLLSHILLVYSPTHMVNKVDCSLLLANCFLPLLRLLFSSWRYFAKQALLRTPPPSQKERLFFERSSNNLAYTSYTSWHLNSLFVIVWDHEENQKSPKRIFFLQKYLAISFFFTIFAPENNVSMN